MIHCNAWFKKTRKPSVVKTVRQKLNDDRKQTVLKHEWEIGLILISSKAKATGSTPVYHAASLHFVLNIFHTLDFCLHTTSSFSKAIKGLSAHPGASKVVRREGQKLLAECGNTEQQDLLYPPCSVPSLLIQTRVSSQEQDSALQSSVTGTSPVCGLSTGTPTTNKERGRG